MSGPVSDSSIASMVTTGLSITVLVVAAWLGRRGSRLGVSRPETSPARSRPLVAETVCFLALMVLAAAFRLPSIEEVPGGFGADEMILAGVMKDLIQMDGEESVDVEPHFANWSQGSTRLAAWIAGRGREDERPAEDFPAAPAAKIGTLRTANALSGIAVVAAIYGAARVLDGPVAALVAAGFAASSHRLVMQSRLGTQGSDFILCQLLTLLFFCLGLRTGRRGWSLLAGLCVGMGMKEYAMTGVSVLWAPVMAILAWVVVRPGERWEVLHRALLPLLAGAALTATADVTSAVTRTRPDLYGHLMMVSVLGDPPLDVLTAFAHHLLIAIGGVLGLIWPLDASGPAPLLSVVVSGCLIFAVFRQRTHASPELGLVFFAFSLTALSMPLIRRVPENILTLWVFVYPMPLLFLLAGRGAAAARADLLKSGRDPRWLLPLLLLSSLMSWIPSGSARLDLAASETVFDNLRLASKLSSQFDVYYQPHIDLSERFYQVDARAVRYIEWAYGIHILKPRLLVPDRSSERPAAFVISDEGQALELQELYPEGIVKQLQAGPLKARMYFTDAASIKRLQGWRLDATSGSPQVPPRLIWAGAIQIPLAGQYQIEVQDTREFQLSLLRRDDGEATYLNRTPPGWFLEGQVPMSVWHQEPGVTPPTMRWRKGDPPGPWREIPAERVMSRWRDQPELWCSWVPSEDALRIRSVSDVELEKLSSLTHDTALKTDGAGFWILRFLPRALWHFDASGRSLPLRQSSAAAQYRMNWVDVDDPNPPGSLELDGKGNLLLPDGDQNRLLRLSTEIPARTEWNAGGRLRVPVHICRVPGTETLVVGSEGDLRVLDSRGRLIRSFPFAVRSDLTVDSRHRILALCPSRGEVVVADLEGRELAAWRCSELTPGSRITVDSLDRIWVLFPETGRIALFDPDGKLLSLNTNIVSEHALRTRRWNHREARPGDLDAGVMGRVNVLLDGRLMVLEAISQSTAAAPDNG